MLSPFLVRIADQAAGLITRKAITLNMEDPEQEVDPYWEDLIEDVDGFGTDITSFARRTVLHSCCWAMPPRWWTSHRLSLHQICRWSVSWVCGPTGFPCARIRFWVGGRMATAPSLRSGRSASMSTFRKTSARSGIAPFARFASLSAVPGACGARVKTAGSVPGGHQQPACHSPGGHLQQ